MADIRNPVGTPGTLVPQARPAPARSEAVRAAQKAFFQAALTGVAAAPAAQPSPRAAAAPAVQAVKLDPQTPPTRPLRPGSLVDIKV